MADEKYIRNLQGIIAARKSAESASAEKENRDAEIVKAQAPNDWKSLKNWLRDTITQLDSEDVTFKENGINSVEVAYRTQRSIRRTTAAFHDMPVAFLSRITVESQIGADVSFEPEVQGRKAVWHLSGDEHRVFDIEGMGKEILSEALKQ